MTSDTPSSQPHVIVIGAGISGLAAAHRLIELGGARVSIVDAAARTGGLLSTDTDDAFLIERGADAFITNKPAALDLCRRLDLESDIIPTDARHRRSLVLHNGRPEPVPHGFQLLMPTDLDAMMQSPLLSADGRARVAAEVNVPPAVGLQDESLASFVRRRFGDELFERLAQPMVGGIYTADPDKLSLLATLPRFLEMEQQFGSLTRAARELAHDAASGARYGLFVSLRLGISQLVDALTHRVQSACRLRLGRAILEIARDNNRWSLSDDHGATETGDAVIVSTPAHQAGRLLRDVSPELSATLSAIEYASSAIVCTTHRLDDFAHTLDAFGLVIPAVEHRPILAVSFASRKFVDRAPAGSIVLRTFVGGAMQPDMLQHTDSQMIEIVKQELADMFGMRAPPQRSFVARYHNAMPQYHIGHVEKVAEIGEYVRQLPGLQLAGNAYTGVGIPDAIASGELAAQRLHQQLFGAADGCDDSGGDRGAE